MICKLCHKEIIRNGDEYGIGQYKTMHDDCIVQDCINTINAGHKLTPLQYNRLYNIGYNKAELVEEYQLNKPVDWNEVRIDFITLR